MGEYIQRYTASLIIVESADSNPISYTIPQGQICSVQSLEEAQEKALEIVNQENNNNRIAIVVEVSEVYLQQMSGNY